MFYRVKMCVRMEKIMNLNHIAPSQTFSVLCFAGVLALRRIAESDLSESRFAEFGYYITIFKIYFIYLKCLNPDGCPSILSNSILSNPISPNSILSNSISPNPISPNRVSSNRVSANRVSANFVLPNLL